VTPRQLEVLDYVRDMITRAGFAPTYQEIADQLGIVKSKAHEHVQALVRAGKLRSPANRMRGIELVDTVDLRAVDTERLRAELARRGESLDALDRPQRRVFARGAVACATSCCDVEVPPGHLFCLRHWRRISPVTQSALLHAHRVATETRSAEDVSRYQEAFTKAKDEAEGAPWPGARAH
jgi:repressor LexA